MYHLSEFEFGYISLCAVVISAVLRRKKDWANGGSFRKILKSSGIKVFKSYSFRKNSLVTKVEPFA